MSKTSPTHKPNLKPIGDRVLVKQLEAETMIGGIILPDSAQQKPEQAEVIALGTGKVDDNGKTLPFHVKVGDTVDSVYQIESANGGQLIFNYKPLNQRQPLAIGATP